MGLSFLSLAEPISTKAIMGRDPFGIFKEGEVHTISYRMNSGDGRVYLCAGIPALFTGLA
jgi:hypothetical protein